MIGALDGLALALERMASAIGGEAIVACDLSTNDPERPLVWSHAAANRWSC